MVLITVLIVVCGSIVEADAIAIDNPHLSRAHASIRQWIIVTKRSLPIKRILEVLRIHCNGLYEMNTCSYGSFIKVVTFMRAFCNLIVLKSREKCTKSRTAHSSEALFTV